MPATKLPKAPTIILSKLVQLREDLNCNVIAKHEGSRLVGPAFIDFVHELHAKMPKVPYGTLLASVQHLAGIPITSEVNKELSWRLAGNQHYLRKGVVVPIHTRQLLPEWVAVQIWDVTRKKLPGWIGEKKEENKVLINKAELNLLILAGTPAGKNITKLFTEKMFFRTETKKMFGFSQYDKMLYNRYFVGTNNYPLSDIRQLVKMRMFIYIDPEESDAGEIAFEHMTCTSAMRKWNRELMQRRLRQNGFQCPKKYDLAQVPCHKCEVGFDYCRAGCHPTTFVKKVCDNCHKMTWHFNEQAQWCVECLAKTA